MYNFVDTVERSIDDSTSKLSEAMRINGEYIEDLIDGYRTLYVKGRESLEKELSSYDYAVRDGARVFKTRYPSRTLTVGFQILSDSAEEYMDKFTELNRVLMVENAEIIFDDEDDVFYIGTPKMNAEVEAGRKNVVAEFDIFCADPFKYSTTVYERIGVIDRASDSNTRTFEIDYEGNIPAHPILIAEMPTTVNHDDVIEKFYEFYISTDPDDLVDGEWSLEYGYEEDNEPVGYVFKREHRILDGGIDSFYPSEGGIRADLFVNEVQPTGNTGNSEEKINGDCGYVAFYDDENNIIQLGNPNQQDRETYDESQVLVNSNFEELGSWDSITQATYPNSGLLLSGYERKGTFALALDHYASKDSASTSATLWGKKHTTGGKTISGKKYNVITYSNLKAVSSNRKDSEITLTVTLKAYAKTNVEKNLGLTGVLRINGIEYSFKIKGGSTAWKGGKTHNIKKTITVKGLTITTNKLTFKFRVTQSGSTGGAMNSVNCNAMSIPTKGVTPQTGYYLTPYPSNFGTGSKWHGAAIKRTVTPSNKFTFSWGTRMCIGNDTKNASEQMGAQTVLLTDSSNKVVAGVKIEKSGVKDTGKVELIVNDKVVKTQTGFSFAYNSKTLGKKTTCMITSTADGKISFNVGGLVYDYTEEHNDVTAISIGVFQRSNNPALRFNGIHSVKFIKDMCDTVVDIPNTFTTGDIVLVDCETAEITVNGIRRPDLGALGNSWEDFKLVSGENLIQGAFSDWVAIAPTLKLRYREVYI